MINCLDNHNNSRAFNLLFLGQIVLQIDLWTDRIIYYLYDSLFKNNRGTSSIYRKVLYSKSYIQRERAIILLFLSQSLFWGIKLNLDNFTFILFHLFHFEFKQ